MNEKARTRMRVMLAYSGAFFLMLSLALFTGTTASAASLPTGTIRLVVPFNAGAGIDVVARIIAKKFGETSGRNVIVENRPGGSTLIGAMAVANSDPDGTTLLFTIDDTFTILPHVSENKSFNVNAELKPVISVANIVNLLVVNPELPVKSLPELIAYARANPGKISYASTGATSSTHLSMEMLKAKAKIDMVHVPYKGNGPAMLAAVAGEIQLTPIGYGTGSSLIEAGKLRPIVVAGSMREPALPDLATTAELGYPEVSIGAVMSISVPAKTSPELVKAIQDALANVMKQPDIQSDLKKRHILPLNIGPEETAKAIQQRYKIAAEAVRIAGVQRAQ